MTPEAFAEISADLHAELIARATSVDDPAQSTLAGLATAGALLFSYVVEFENLDSQGRAHHARLTRELGGSLSATSGLVPDLGRTFVGVLHRTAEIQWRG